VGMRLVSVSFISEHPKSKISITLDTGSPIYL
jgi:hypothetical protein